MLNDAYLLSFVLVRAQAALAAAVRCIALPGSLGPGRAIVCRMFSFLRQKVFPTRGLTCQSMRCDAMWKLLRYVDRIFRFSNCRFVSPTDVA